MSEFVPHAQQEDVQLEDNLGELEALLFAASRPLAAVQIARRLSLDEAHAEALLAMLAERLQQRSRGLQLRHTGTGWRLETKPQHSDIIAAERTARREKPLTAQALEVLAVIALAQPVTAEDISRTRGAESYAAIETLRRHGLVAIAESRGPSGKATRWRSTQRFLDRLGLRSLEQLAARARARHCSPTARSRGSSPLSPMLHNPKITRMSRTTFARPGARSAAPVVRARA